MRYFLEHVLIVRRGRQGDGDREAGVLGLDARPVGAVDAIVDLRDASVVDRRSRDAEIGSDDLRFEGRLYLHYRLASLSVHLELRYEERAVAGAIDNEKAAAFRQGIAQSGKIERTGEDSIPPGLLGRAVF